MNKRDNTFDILKGIAIISVVFYHTIPHFFTSDNFPVLMSFVNFFNQFQIPLFLFVSGYFFYFSLNKNFSFKVLIIKKINHLLIPYVIFGSLLFFSKALYFVYKGLYEINLADYMKASVTMHSIKIINNNGLGFGPAWFLLMLFIITLISYFTLYRKGIAEVIFWGFIIYSIIYVNEVTTSPEYNLSTLCYFIIPFQSGYFFNKYRIFESHAFTKPRNQNILLGFSLLFAIFYKILEYNSIVNSKTIGIALILIFLLYLLTIKDKGKFKLLDYLGNKSMAIYLLHAPYFIMAGLLLTKFFASYSPFITFLKIVLVTFISIIGPLVLNHLYQLVTTKFKNESN